MGVISVIGDWAATEFAIMMTKKAYCPRRNSMLQFVYEDYPKKLNKMSYFEAGRSPRKRSLQEVNEHFEDKPDAKRAFLFGF